jgi:hypothetical protein
MVPLCGFSQRRATAAFFGMASLHFGRILAKLLENGKNRGIDCPLFSRKLCVCLPADCSGASNPAR